MDVNYSLLKIDNGSSDKRLGDVSVRIAPLCDFVSATALQCYSSFYSYQNPDRDFYLSRIRDFVDCTLRNGHSKF